MAVPIFRYGIGLAFLGFGFVMAVACLWSTFHADFRTLEKHDRSEIYKIFGLGVLFYVLGLELLPMIFVKIATTVLLGCVGVLWLMLRCETRKKQAKYDTV
jgi:hypothetical protein